jgi:hypothetical protein
MAMLDISENPDIRFCIDNICKEADMSYSYRSKDDDGFNKKAKKKWIEPEDKSQWLLDLIDAGESAVKGYEKYLLNELDYAEFAKVMMVLRGLLPMNIDKKYSEKIEDDDDNNKDD